LLIPTALIDDAQAKKSSICPHHKMLAVTQHQHHTDANIVQMVMAASKQGYLQGQHLMPIFFCNAGT